MKRFFIIIVISFYLVLGGCNNSDQVLSNEENWKESNIKDTVQVKNKEYDIDKLPDWNYRTTENIKHIPDWVSEESTWCYNDNPENCENYWRLYKYEVAKKVCKSLGNWWTLPSDKDWKNLESSFGCDEEELEKNQMQDMWCDIEGTTDSEWRCSSLVENKENLIWFDWFINELPGYRVFLGEFNRLNKGWYWWTSTTEKDSYSQEERVWIRSIENNSESIIRSIENKENWYSVRCLKK